MKGSKFNAKIDLLKKCWTETFKNILKLNDIDNNTFINIINKEIDPNLSESESDDINENFNSQKNNFLVKCRSF